MRALKEFAIAALVLLMTQATAHALTDDEQAQLNNLFAQAPDATAGVEVGGSTITVSNGGLLQGEDACTFSRLLNADEDCYVSAIVFPPGDVGIDSIYYSTPEDIGYVNMDDWTDDVNSQIDEIWEGYVAGTKEQSERIGFDVVPLKWALYPTLNRDSKILTYGILLDFGGDRVINLTAVKFTRSGYVTMNIVTDAELLAANLATLDGVSTYASNTYAPGSGLRYADFKDGDKIAAIGAVGVLASVVGVKYGKGTLAAIVAMILLVAKKFWVLLLVVPAAIWGAVKKLAGRRDTST